ncbi:MAG: hypothetical protein L3J68_01910 [Thermoplasmata archaeon]|nr:hypothetical protein [Thermoplasmata archaeon]
MTTEELGILDLSKVGKGEWVPPIGAMGGPPAHELYRDLVIHAGLRLLRDETGTPWVEIQDGEHRRAFPAPSLELRAALDRFRMRRNLRPVPEGDIEEFARVVEARVSDPDIEVAVEISPTPGRLVLAGGTSPGETSPIPAPRAGANWAVDELDHLMHEVDSIQGRAPEDPPEEAPETGASWYAHPGPIQSRLPHRWHTGMSSARQTAPAPNPRLPRYIRVLRELVQNGTWIGSLTEIARRTGDDTDEVFAALLQFHTDFVGNDLVVAPVEVEDGWKWVVVDRGRMRDTPSRAE